MMSQEAEYSLTEMEVGLKKVPDHHDEEEGQ